MTSNSGRGKRIGKAILAVAVAGSIAPATTAFAQANLGTEVRAIDGSNNNLLHPGFGVAGARLLREASGFHYGDGISTMARANGPSPRAASSGVFTQSGSLPNHLGISDFIWTFGQFLDHDISLTEGNGGDGLTDAFIKIPAFDIFFDPFGSGNKTMSFHRGMFDPTTGTTTPRQQINQITAFIDGSNVYGSDNARATFLRTFVGGRLKVARTPVGDLCPFNDGTQGNAGNSETPNTSSDFMVAGDIRINEQPTLAAMHILFVREHNFQADRIARARPNLTDEQVFQGAREIVIGELQHITVEEFIPALFGNATGIGPYTGYNPDTNPGVSAVFSTAAYRVGHTLLSTSIKRLNADGNSVPEGPLRLRDSFFSAAPPLIAARGIEPFLRGVANQKAQELDNKVIDEVRNFLFGLPGAGGLDLIALNLQRGRDMGLPDYNTVRADFGLPRVTRFSDITRNAALATTLQQLYGNVNRIDPFVGMFAEDHQSGFNIGETLRAVFTNQFRRLRTGDRFWYERSLTASDLQRVRNTTLADVIKRNTTITQIQSNVFFVPGFGQPAADPGI